MRNRWKLIAGLLVCTAASGIAVAELAPGTELNRPFGVAAEVESEGEECASGVAIDVTLGMVCSQYCTTDADCTALPNWGCRKVYQGNGDRVGICFPYRAGITP